MKRLKNARKIVLQLGCACMTITGSFYVAKYGLAHKLQTSFEEDAEELRNLTNYWSLTKLCHSQNLQRRSLGVNALVSLGALHDYKLQQICQSSDFSVLAALIIKRLSLKKFLTDRLFKTKAKLSIEDECVNLLESVSSLTNDPRLRYFANLALNKLPNVSTVDLETFASGSLDFPSSTSLHESPSYRHLLLHVKALEAQSTDASQCRHMVHRGVFDLLKRLWFHGVEYQNRLEISVLKILANLSVHPNLGVYFQHTGWLAILEDCLNSPKLEYFLIANKILHNLAASYQNGAAKFFDSVYLINGGQWDKKQPVLDVIFIHGLRGGLFHTWRQGNLKADKKNGLPEDLPEIHFTSCWPKDWLPNDLNGPVRVLAVDYESHLSDWIPRCPDVKFRHRLDNRSKDILKKLKYAGVGDRPIIWVAHSMGGLAVKRMLNVIKDEDEKEKWSSFDGVLSQTRGCVFYSTPHFGSPVASSVQGWSRHFFLPSVEVSELIQNSNNLVQMHKKFKENAQKHGFKLINLSESRPTRIAQLKLNILLVPKNSAFGSDHIENTDSAQSCNITEEHFKSNEVFYPLNSNHFDICKPTSKASLNYRILVDFVDEILSNINVE